MKRPRKGKVIDEKCYCGHNKTVHPFGLGGCNECGCKAFSHANWVMALEVSDGKG